MMIITFPLFLVCCWLVGLLPLLYTYIRTNNDDDSVCLNIPLDFITWPRNKEPATATITFFFRHARF